MNHCPKSLCALFFSILLCLGITSPATSMVVAADEIVVTEVTSTEIVKNEKWVKLEQEVATPQFQIASKTDPEGTAQYLFNKYDGAELFAGGINQRLQNGGWNVYYNTSNGNKLQELHIMACMLRGQELGVLLQQLRHGLLLPVLVGLQQPFSGLLGEPIHILQSL